MSAALSTGLDLSGPGAAYLRVSTDKQDTDRQVESVRAFEVRHRVKIADRFWFEDHGWERDADEKRPEFNRLLKLAAAGQVRWIVVDSLDRFGTKSAKRLFRYLDELEEAGCRLFDVTGKEWTGEDMGTELAALVGGMTSAREQKEKSSRVLGGMIGRARAGEWMGGPPRLGFDVGCFSRETDRELWRVVWEGRNDTGNKELRRGKKRPVYRVLRRKVYPDGRAERLDGEVNFRESKETQVMRLTPTADPARLAAAKGVFARYASEAVTFFELAKWLNGLGIRNSFGGRFQAGDVSKMLADEAYLGYPTFRKRRTGRFHRYDAELNKVVELEPELRGKDTASDPADVIRSGRRLYEPMVDRPTWDAVQRKLRGRGKATRAAPKNPELFLAGLVVCAGCGTPMVARTDRMEYYCGTWDRHRTRGDLANSPCERNGVRQAEIEEHVATYLDHAGAVLAALTDGLDADHLTGRLEGQEAEAWAAFTEGVSRLGRWLAEHRPAEYETLVVEFAEMPRVPHPGAGWADEDDFAFAVIGAYREHFDPAAAAAERERLDAELTRLTDGWADLPAGRAKEKAKARLAELEARLDELDRQGTDAAATVAAYYHQVRDLERAVADARRAMRADAGDRALRHRAEALRGLLCRIDCEFVLTGVRGNGGPGNARSKLVAVTFRPVAGDAVLVRPDNPRESDRQENVGQRVYGNP